MESDEVPQWAMEAAENGLQLLGIPVHQSRLDKLAHIIWEACQQQLNHFGCHLSHCNYGENPNHCKYAEDGCPALTEEWSWFGDRLQRAEKERAEHQQQIAAAEEAASRAGYAAGLAEAPLPECCGSGELRRHNAALTAKLREDWWHRLHEVVIIEYSRNHGEPEPTAAFPVRAVIPIEKWNELCESERKLRERCK